MISIQVHGANEVGAALMAMAARAPVKARSITAFYGAMYQTRVKAAASGRPGPRVITGDYRRSIALEMVTVAGGPGAMVYTNKPQGRRLERGFVGVDSLGRHFSQPPYPHFEPPLAPTVREYAEALASGLSDWPGA